MAADVVAPPISSPSRLEALALLLLAVCAQMGEENGRLTRELAEQVAANRGMVAENEELKRRTEELTRRLGLNSTNSSKPPSSDGLKRQRRTARSPERERRKRLGRKPGKQKGTPGHHLAPVAEPKRVVPLLPAFCGKCGRSLVENSREEGMEKRQVIDLPPPSGLEATEYQAYRLRCECCGEMTKAAFPEWVKARCSTVLSCTRWRTTCGPTSTCPSSG